MSDQLLFDLTSDTASRPSIHFCERSQFDPVAVQLAEKGVKVMTLDGATIGSREELYKAFAGALRKPKGWYGDEEYATNADAFLEYLEDVAEWNPASGHVAVVESAENLWREHPRIAGFLVELWQFATVAQGARIHLVFSW